jgi:hypothetical protein
MRERVGSGNPKGVPLRDERFWMQASLRRIVTMRVRA